MAIIPIGEIGAAGDVTTAQVISTIGSASQVAVDARVVPLVEEAVSQTPAVAAAAAALAQEDAGLVRTGDERLPRLGGGAYTHPFTDADWRLLGGFRKSDGVFVATAGIEAPNFTPGGGGVVATRRDGLALTCAQGTTDDAATAGAVRLPLRMPVDGKLVAVHFRNYNDRTAVAYGNASITGLWFGQHGRAASGALDGTFASGPTSIAAAFTATGASEAVVPITPNVNLLRGEEYLLSFGYTSAGPNHGAVAGAWRSTVAADGGSAGGTWTKSAVAPFDVWVEVEVAGDVRSFAVIGDSNSVGTAADLPVHDSWVSVVALARGMMPRFYANHGTTIDSWLDAGSWKFQKYAGLDPVDVAVINIGANDWGNGDSLASMQDSYRQLVAVVRANVAESVFACTMKGRNSGAGSTTVRADFNAWLQQLPCGIVQTFDYAAQIDGSTAPQVDARWISSDSVHLNTAGYARAALAVQLS